MFVYKIIIGKDMAPQNKNTSQCKSVRGKKKKKNCIYKRPSEQQRKKN